MAKEVSSSGMGCADSGIGEMRAKCVEVSAEADKRRNNIDSFR